MTDEKRYQKATFAGGCFWCMQSPYDKITGVIKTTVGYTGGHTKNPSYEEVCSGTTGHAEAIEIIFDPYQVLYTDLLDIFWKNIDPTTLNRQFADSGPQYRTVIFYHDEEQKKLAQESLRRLENSKKFDTPIITEIVPAGQFYPAENYHQKYYDKNPVRYKFYLKGSGREEFLNKTCGVN